MSFQAIIKATEGNKSFKTFSVDNTARSEVTQGFLTGFLFYEKQITKISSKPTSCMIINFEIKITTSSLSNALQLTKERLNILF